MRTCRTSAWCSPISDPPRIGKGRCGIRVGSMRGVGSPDNIFVAECFMDELARRGRHGRDRVPPEARAAVRAAIAC